MAITATRLAGAVGRRLRSPAVRLGLLPYRSVSTQREEIARQRDGEYDYLARIDELARYSIITGYVRWLGGEPSIVDVGCGAGLLRERLMGTPLRRYAGIDPSPDAIQRSQRLADERTAFMVGDPAGGLDRAGLSAGEFDICTALDVLYVCDDPALLLDSIRELVRPGGHFLCSNHRHPGDTALVAMIDERFVPVDAVEVRSLTRRGGRVRRWRISCHRRER